MNDVKSIVSRWCKQNVDFAFFLAAFTETPRWTVVFIAIHESPFVGVPLGVLLSFATSKAWRAYFDTRHNGLLILNIASMVIAVMVIAPVLFAMTQVQAYDVHITHVLSTWLVWAWAFLLALTAFIPLGQLAFVRGIEQQNERETEQPKQKQVTRTVRDIRAIEQSEQFTVVQPKAIEQPVTKLIEQSTEIDLSTLSEERKREHLAGVLRTNSKPNKSALAKQLGIGRTTLYTWIEELQS